MRLLERCRLQRRRRDEQGSVAIVVAAMSLVLLVVGALTVDLGMQRVARRDMQSLADVVALDLARELDGRTVTTLSPLLPALAEQSRQRNAGTLGERPTFTIALGSLSSTGQFTPMTSGVPTAVQVTARTRVDFAFGIASSGGASRSAVSTVQAGACIRVGSYIASVNTAQSALLNPLLGGLLGSTVNLTAVKYDGLAKSDITLAELATVGGLGAGTPSEVLALRNVSLRDFYLASAKVLDAQGKTSEADALRLLSAAAGTPTINIADLISAAPGDTSALTSRFNVLQLVQGSALLSHNGSAVSIPGLTANVGIGTTTASLQVIEAPQIKCGLTGIEARTAQVRLTLTTRLAGQTLNVPALATNVTLDPVDVVVSFNLGEAIARLTAINCSATGVDSLSVALRSAVVGTVNVSARTHVKATVGVPLVGGGGILGTLLTSILSRLGLGSLLYPPSLEIDNFLDLTGGSAGSTFTKNLTLPIPGAYTTPVGGGTGALIGSVNLTPTSGQTILLKYRNLLGQNRELTILSTEGLFTQAIDPITSTVLTSVVNPLISSLQTNVLTPLTALLGIQYGGADVNAVPTATCAGPKLVG
jgi:uncharacterized membrane protein